MPNNYFKFKQFNINQANTAHKVGTDSVLLACFANIEHSQNILDLGSGTGLIGISVAQRNPKASIDCIEIDENAIIDLKENISESPFSKRIEAIHGDFFQHNFSKKYDYIISNPPYFAGTPFSISENRLKARHRLHFEWNLFFEKSAIIGSDNVIIGIIIPFDILQNVIIYAAAAGFYSKRILYIQSFINSPIIRVCIEFHRYEKNENSETLYIYNGDKTYSENYKKLTSDFYLKF